MGRRLRRQRRARLEGPAGRGDVGYLGHPGVQPPHLSGRPRRPRRDRARVRDRLHLGLAGAARRSPGRHRQLRGPARHGPPPAGGARHRVPPDLRQRRDRPAPRRELRSRDLRVRREHLGRPLSLGSRGGTPAATRRPARIPGERNDPEPVRARRRGAGDGPPGASLLRAPPARVVDDTSVNFCLGYGDWIRLLRSNGFDVEDLLELRPAEGATTDDPYVTPEWARQWPSEEVWK